MYSTPWHKRLLRPLGVEIKRFDFGLDPWADLPMLFAKKPARTVLDVGANLGQTSRQLAGLLPEARIWAFEPNPRIFSQLQQNLAGESRVKAVNVALGDKAGQMTLNITSSSVNTSILKYAREDGEDRVVEQVQIPVETADAFCAANGITELDLFKTDVQGFDLPVFQGAADLFARGAVKAVLCEVLFRTLYEGQCSFQDVFAHLTAQGLKFCGLYHAVRERDFHIHWADALFVLPGHFRERTA
jgi:FkbM family methyltransferase